MNSLRNHIDLMSESKIETKIQKISKNFGGGKIVTHMNMDDDGDVESYSYSYVNEDISLENAVLTYEVDGRDIVTSYHYLKYPEGMACGKLSDEEIRKDFAAQVTQYMKIGIKENIMMNNDKENDTNSVMNEFMKISDFIILSRQRRREKMNKNIDENVASDEIVEIQKLAGNNNTQ